MVSNITSQINKIKSLPMLYQGIIAAIPTVLFIALFVILVFMPKNEKIQTLNTQLDKLDSDIASSEAKIMRLDDLIAENKILTAKLAKLKEQLPEEKEVSVLLKQISELGLMAGLEIVLWKPQSKKTESSGLYVEIPVNVEVIAEYHKLGDFYSHISRLPRLVNISDIQLMTDTKASKEKAGSGLINASFTARTFASANQQDIAASQAAQGNAGK
ncbi:MAG: type 4a pilus biogenesis protein PilO [Nitrospiraceae bacterium]|nr:MAG: type 4a pilus biogenesis protein PilO [Nitrospiraceae bacterium]